MPRHVDRDQVERIAHLARLRLTEDETEAMTRELDAVIAYVDRLAELDTGEVEPTAHAASVMNVFRDDVPADSLSADDALGNAPARDGSFFKVPKVIGVDDGA